MYIDDILISGASDQEHLDRLEEVFIKVEEAGLRFRKDKGVFMQPSVEYLGHIIDKLKRHLHPAMLLS